MRVPTAVAALTISAALLLVLPATASAHVSPLLQPAVVVPAPGTSSTLAPIDVDPAAPITEPTVPGPVPPTSAPTPVPVPEPSRVPEPSPVPVPSSSAPVPAPDPATTPPSTSPATSVPVPVPDPVPGPTGPDGGSAAIAEEGAPIQSAERPVEMPAEAAVVPRAPRTPTTSAASAPRTSTPSTSPSTSEAVSPGADDAEASQQLGATEPSVRHVAAGVLSIVAVLIALAIAFVAQPRKPRHTH